MSIWNWFGDDKHHSKSDLMVGESLKKWHTDVDQWFDNTMKEIANFRWHGRKPGDLFQPKVDISETDKHYKITIEMPGVTPKDLMLESEHHTLSISGKKESIHEEKGHNIHKIEGTYGDFQRVITVPEDADMNSIRAEFIHGILHISINRTHMPSTKRIVDIKIASEK